MTNVIPTIIIVGGVWTLFATMIEAYFSGNCNYSDLILFPSDIYEMTKMNWFGSWFVYILISIFNPVFFVFKMLVLAVVNICYFVKWLFTVGREDD